MELCASTKPAHPWPYGDESARRTRRVSIISEASGVLSRRNSRSDTGVVDAFQARVDTGAAADIFKIESSLLDFDTVQHQGLLRCWETSTVITAHTVKTPHTTQPEGAQFALTNTHVWIDRSGRHTPFVDLLDILAIYAEQNDVDETLDEVEREFAACTDEGNNNDYSTGLLSWLFGSPAPSAVQMVEYKPAEVQFVVEVKRSDFLPGARRLHFAAADQNERDTWIEALTSYTTAAHTQFSEDNETGAEFSVPTSVTEEDVNEELRLRRERGLAEAKLTLLELISTKGYPAEMHEVETSDGYILTVHRVKHGKRAQEEGLPVVFMMHGFMDCSATWVINRDTQSLAYILANAGYDVWMGNNRGTRHGKAHKTHCASGSEFWEFNRDSLVTDVRDMIDYALKHTGKSHLSYIGHSQGAGLAFALLSADPAFRQKVNLFIALGPAVFMQNQQSGMLSRLCGSLQFGGEWTLKTFGVRQFFGADPPSWANWLPHPNSTWLFDNPKPSTWFVTHIFSALCGWNPDNNFNMDRIPIIAAHEPGGVGIGVMIQWAQAMRSGRFCKYDYGRQRNMELYESETGPDYPLGTSCPVVPVNMSCCYVIHIISFHIFSWLYEKGN
eukprot:TRINITY_DN10328_c0_g1_i1.p1 TRINITY_DN10328_c0_g1~~TRINITY_DN10328_c0_g1_i1.p1  ORF type:complete len:614 (-),score=68.36 TRINITY_DN10328_c0_g1_i1:47-1888(-)